MSKTDGLALEITPQVLLKAYACGIFPMAESADDPGLYWIEPERRGVLPLDGFHVPRRLARTVRSDVFEVRVDTDFGGIIGGCAAPVPGRRKTWINERIRRLYGDLFDIGYCHTIETWRDGRLVGGLYGVGIGAFFAGESMFHHRTDASKAAVAGLAALMAGTPHALVDVQWSTPHLASLGVIEIERADYLDRLRVAVGEPGPAALSG